MLNKKLLLASVISITLTSTAGIYAATQQTEANPSASSKPQSTPVAQTKPAHSTAVLVSKPVPNQPAVTSMTNPVPIQPVVVPTSKPSPTHSQPTQHLANVAPTTASAVPSALQHGDRLSLNFQDIKVRAVLQLIAEFTGLNIVASDSVQGNITLHLNNVPWQQALDIILQSQGLAKRHEGNVLLIAPLQEMTLREKSVLEAQQQQVDMAPLRSELIQINYGKAEDMATLLKGSSNSILSSRGNVSVDTRTNNLWVQDTTQRLTEIRRLIRQLDKPVRQVLIEARVVNIDSTYEEDLGIRFGITKASHLSGTLNGANIMQGGNSSSSSSSSSTGTAPVNIDVADRLNVDLPATPSSFSPATIGLALARLGGGVLLDLELSALQSEGVGEVIANPRLITADQQAATIQQGEEIPYQEATSSGATNVAFKKAVLSLQVTPQITPDNKLILHLKVNQDKRSTKELNGVPAIDTRQIETEVVVDNGQTVVLGGIYEQDKTNNLNRVPFLSTLPGVGDLFKNKQIIDERKELLIFITPKIIQQPLATVR